MQGKTHLAFGCASALTMLGVNDVPTIVAGMTVASIGAIMSDIDIENSTARKELKSTVFISSVLAMASPLITKTMGLGNVTLTSLLNLSPKVIPGLVLLTLYIIMGLRSEHRGFTHSIEGFGISSFAMWLITPSFYNWYVVAYISHIAIDLLNKKKLRLTMLSKKGFCLNLCTANGATNYLIKAGSIILVIYKLFTLQM